MSTSGINAMLTQAKSAPGMVLNATTLDADPYVLCAPESIVDLRTGLLRAGPEQRLQLPIDHAGPAAD
ncbi:DNA primase, partial [Streptomyces sp. NPDC057717]